MGRWITEEEATQQLADWLADREWTADTARFRNWTEAADAVLEKVIAISDRLEPEDD